MDYEKEEQTAQQTLADNPKGNYWKAKEGRYKIRILSDPEPFLKPANPPKFPEPTKCVRMNIEVDGAKYIWERPRKYGDKAVWGMLVRLGAALQKEGKSLTGSIITLKVKGTDKDTTYDIDELYDVIERQKKQAEEKKAAAPAAPSSRKEDAMAFI